MDEEKKQVEEKKSPIQKLNTIDDTLANAYPAPREFAFSKNEDERIVQKAVLYHRLRKDPDLSGGQQSPEADKKYEELATAIIEGGDPVVEYIREKGTREKADLLREITESDQKTAKFEELVTAAARNKAEAAAINRQLAEEEPEEEKKIQQQAPQQQQPQEKQEEPEKKKPEEEQEKKKSEEAKPEEKKAEEKKVGEKKPLPLKETSQKFKAEAATLRGDLLKKMADMRDKRPAEFFSDPKNMADMRRLIAIKVHMTKVDREEREYKESLRYEKPEDKAGMMKERPPFPSEIAAAQNYEGYLRKLLNSPEVIGVLRQMQKESTVADMGKATVDNTLTQQMHTHDNIARMENRMVPGAVKAFFTGPDAPGEDSRLRKKLNELSSMQQKKEFPPNPTEEDCRKRIEEYKTILELLEKEGKLDTPGGKELQEVLSGQIRRLDDTMVAAEREKVSLAYRADTLIDYYDVNDPEHRPMDAVEAREKLIRGGELEQMTFAGDDFCGTTRKLTYDKKTGKINRGPEKLVTRVVDLARKTEGQPMMQLEELRKIKEVLSRSDPFYIKNSGSYTKTMQSLDKVIKAQESLDKEANVRQIAELRSLYGELDANAELYLKENAERKKPGNDLAQIRSDAFRTLRSITGKDHVEKVAESLYTEQSKLAKQQKMMEPCKAVMDKWKKAGTPTTPEGIAEFRKDFNGLTDRIGQLKASGSDLTYFKMGMADGLDRFTRQAEEVQKKIEDPNAMLDGKKLENMQGFRDACQDSMMDFYAMDSTISTQKKKEEKLEKVETIQSPQKKNTGMVK